MFGDGGDELDCSPMNGVVQQKHLARPSGDVMCVGSPPLGHSREHPTASLVLPDWFVWARVYARLEESQTSPLGEGDQGWRSVSDPFQETPAASSASISAKRPRWTRVGAGDDDRMRVAIVSELMERDLRGMQGRGDKKYTGWVY